MTVQSSLKLLIALSWGAGLSAMAQPAVQPAPAKAPSKDDSLRALLRTRIESILKILADGGDFKKAEAELRKQLDLAVAWIPADQADVLVDVDAAVRLVSQLQSVRDPKERASLFALLNGSRALARELVFAIGPYDDAAAAYGVLATLRTRCGDRVGAYPSLTAALCIVYDAPRQARASTESKPEPIDPAALFDYFTRNEQRMAFGLNSLPTDLMVHLVSTTAMVDELEWALKTYPGDRNVGKRYSDLTYDTASFKYNKPKKIASMPYTLPNLRKVGGVCEEQAYFAAHVARAIGVPAAYIYGQNADMSHAWVGFLQDRGGIIAWNMDEGHYDEYEKILGSVTDPHTGQQISDSELAMSAESYRLATPARHAAAALVDAAWLLQRDSKQWPPKLDDGIAGTLSRPRPLGRDGALQLLEAATTTAPCSPAVWKAVKAAAEQDLITGAARQQFFDVLSANCGKRYPGFGYGITAALIATVVDPAEQSRAWDWAFQTFRMRPDLAADARISQGDLWKRAGDKARAYDAYLDVVKQFANEGVFVVGALERAEALLDEAKKDSAIVDMYRDAWRRISRPSSTSAGSFRQSNFFRVGERYAAALDRIGQSSEAANVRRQIERGVEKEK